MKSDKCYPDRAVFFPGILQFCIFLLLALMLSNSFAGSILTTKHNLAISGPGPIKSTEEEEVCIFCHTPHQARRDTPYLWNREDSTSNYTTYDSSTINALVGQPSGASKLCLSCHDGTIALGSVLTRPLEIPFANGIRFLPEGKTKVGSDLSDDHPVSFIYDAALAATNTELNSPATLQGEVKLDGQSLLQCTSCHDPHNDNNGKFLVLDNLYSALCITCHNKTNWSNSSHSNSQATWNGVSVNPWPHTNYTTVEENACLSCHSSHTANGHARLLNFTLEEDNCLVCHNGNVAGKDIQAELVKQYAHPVQNTTGIHDPAEDFTGAVTSHVECSDCHDPHQANFDGTEAPPAVSGALKGVNGITSAGTNIDMVENQYEVCFKCHGDNNVVGFSAITRQNQEVNTRLEFDINNPSFHPVEGVGTNPNVPSLITSYTENSIIYCTDCHNKDGGSAPGSAEPNGPHGSIHEYLLEQNYTTLDNTQESEYEYALCYKCHDRNILLNDASGFLHDEHVRKEDSPCSACHDPHGISNAQGNSTNNAHLINFDINIVSPNSAGLLFYESLGTFQGQCYLLCHGEDHNPEKYPD